jgi:filamentous hemagglutinin family protein
MRRAVKLPLSTLARRALPSTIQACLPLVGLSASLFVASSGLSAGTPIAATLPAGCSIVSGSGSITSLEERTLRITQSSAALTIACDHFDVDANAAVVFEQSQDVESTAIVRIHSPAASRISGTLSANGRVALLDSDGLIFGAGSKVNVGGLVASSLDIGDADFAAGTLNFVGGDHPGAVSNEGVISAGQGGRVYLVAPQVQNAGRIAAPQGDVLLAAGRSAQLIEDGGLDLHIVSGNAADRASNLGGVTAPGGKIGIYGGLIEQNGVVNADGAAAGQRGEVVLQSRATTLLAGDSRTSATGVDKGGNIRLLGPQVGVTDAAVVDVSGNAGGGTLLIGGDYHGENPAVDDADATYVGANTTLKADAMEHGDGGRIVVWSDTATRSYGKISARGGVQGGDGGFVENSSAQNMDFHAAVDVGADGGRGGTLLLDPSTITIVGGSGDGAADGIKTFAGNPSGTTGQVLFSDTGPTAIYQSELQGLPRGTSLVLQATDYINTAGSFTGGGAGGTLLLPAATNLTLTTRNGSTDGTGTKGIDLTTSTGGVNLVIQTQGSNLTLQTGTGVSPQAANIQAVPIITGAGRTSAGRLTLSASGSVVTRGINTYSAPNPGANVSITAGSYISVGASIDTHGYMSSPGGAITLAAGGPIVAQGGASLIGNSLNATASGGIYSGTSGPVQSQVSTLMAANTGSGIINIANSGGNLNIIGVSQSGSGAVTVANTTSGYGITLSGSASTQGGAITLQADAMSLSGGTITTNGSAPITLQPTSGGRNIDIGGVAGQFPSSLQLLTGDLDAALPSGGVAIIGNSPAGALDVDTSWSPSLSQLTLKSGATVTLTGGLSISGSVDLDAGTGIAVNSALTATGGTISMLTSSGDITEMATGGVTASNLSAVAMTGSVALGSANNTVSAVTGTSGSAGGFAFADSSGFQIRGITATGGPVTLISSGGITDPNRTTVAGTSLQISAAIGIGTQSAPLLSDVGSLQATNTTAGDIAVSNTGDLSVSDIGALGYGISQQASGNVYLNSSGFLTLSAPVQLSGATGNLGLSGATGIAINAAVSASTGTLSMLSAGGSVTQTSPIVAAGLTADLTGTSSTGGVTLSSAGNAVGTLGAVTASAFSLNNGGSAITLGHAFTLNLPSPPAPGQMYTLISNAASVSGTLTPTQVNGLSAGEAANFSYPPGQAILTITNPPTHFAVVASPSTVTAGTALTTTVTALDAANNPVPGYTGTVRFASSDAQAALPANYTFTPGDAGAHVFANGVTLKTAGTQTVAAADTAASIAGTSNSITVQPGAAAHLSVTAPASATAETAFPFTVTAFDAYQNTAKGYTGTVQFSSTDTKAVLPASATLSNGAGTFSTTLITSGAQTLTANDTVTPSISGQSKSIAVSAVTIALTPSTLPAGTYAQSYAATSLNASGGTAPYTFAVTGGSLPSGISLSTAGSLSGTPTATYASGTNFTVTATDKYGLTGTQQLALTVNPIATTTTLKMSPTTIGVGQTATLTATVAPAAGNSTPTGTVTFTDSGAPIASCSGVTLSGGQAICTTAALGLGAHALQADYGGDANDQASSGTLTQSVGAGATTTTLTASPAMIVYGQSATFTATVAPATGNSVPKGTVIFSDGGTNIAGCSSVMLASGQATCTTTTLAAGTHSVQASYGGDAGNQASSGTATEVVSAVSTSMTLAASPNPPTSTQNVTLTASVTTAQSVPTASPSPARTTTSSSLIGDPQSLPAAASSAVPSGTVSFYDGTTSLGTSNLDTSGVATFTLAPLAPGAHTLSATYAGGGNYLQATAQITLTVGSAPVSVAVAAPTLSLWALLLLSTVLACLGVARVRVASRAPSA